MLKAILILLLFIAPAHAGVDFERDSDEYFTLTSGSAYDFAGDFSMSCWVKPETLDATQPFPRIFHYHSTSQEWDFGLHGDTPANNDYAMFACIDDDNDYDEQTALNSITAGVWQHVGAVFDQGTTSWVLYINGAVSAGIDEGNCSYGDSGQFTLGTRLSSGVGNADLDGVLSDCYIWSAELTAAEMAILGKSYVKGIGTQIQSSALELYLPMDDYADGTAISGTIRDLSTNSNDGTPANTPTAKGEEILSSP